MNKANLFIAAFGVASLAACSAKSNEGTTASTDSLKRPIMTCKDASVVLVGQASEKKILLSGGNGQLLTTLVEGRRAYGGTEFKTSDKEVTSFKITQQDDVIALRYVKNGKVGEVSCNAATDKAFINNVLIKELRELTTTRKSLASCTDLKDGNKVSIDLINDPKDRFVEVTTKVNGLSNVYFGTLDQVAKSNSGTKSEFDLNIDSHQLTRATVTEVRDGLSIELYRLHWDQDETRFLNVSCDLGANEVNSELLKSL